jgi:CHAD domain-containing protein
LSEDIHSLVANAIAAHIDLLSTHLPHVPAAKAPVHIHQSRVACRRLRALLLTFASYLPTETAVEWNRTLRKFMRTLGRARDMDVQIQALEKFVRIQPDTRHVTSLRRLNLRLEQARRRVQPKIGVAITVLEQSEILAQLNLLRDQWSSVRAGCSSLVLTTELSTLCSEQVTRLLDNMLAFEPMIHDPKNVTQLHDMRIAAKKLRYTMEVFESVQPSAYGKHIKLIKKLQSLMGDVHDCDVWLEFMEAFQKQEEQRHLLFFGSRRGYQNLQRGFSFFYSAKSRERERKYVQFVAYWRGIRTENKIVALQEFCAPTTNFTSGMAS